MNGLLSEPQEFVLETLRQFNALRLDQIKWLLQTKYKSRYGTINIRSVMRQLAYMGKVQAQENLWCALWRKPVPTLIDAFDIMMLMCDDTVPQFRVEHDQCQLTFYLPGGAGELPNSFKVYYVIGGQEMDACETSCTSFLLLLRSNGFTATNPFLPH